jgi:hypothetical protein
MILNKVYIVIGVSALLYCNTLIANISPLKNHIVNIREYKINNLKQQNNILISNINREFITTNKENTLSFNCFSVEDNNFGVNLYFKRGRKKNDIWNNFCLDTSIKYNLYNNTILLSCIYNYLNYTINNKPKYQKMINLAISEISLYKYIDSILTIFINYATHNPENLNHTNTYGVAYSVYHNIYIDSFTMQLMLTTRYLDINTSINNNKDRVHLISIGSVITIQKSYMLKNYTTTFGIESGYLRTINTNTSTYIKVIASSAEKILNNIQAQHDWYFLSSISLCHKNIIVGVEISHDHDKYKKLYGASTYIKIRF